MTAIIRDAKRDDLSRLAPLVADQPLLQRYAMTPARLGEQLAGALDRGEELIVVEEEGEPVGFAWFLLRGTFAAGGYLRLIALVPGYEGKGHGTLLLDELEKRMATVSRHAFLLVSHWNDAARRFYGRRGYTEAGLLPAFVRPDTDEIILWKRLK
jgi:ribosomal protein S18 acetylase RimI-like enzyme